MVDKVDYEINYGVSIVSDMDDILDIFNKDWNEISKRQAYELAELISAIAEEGEIKHGSR